MEKKELTNIPGMEADNKVIIWKMNYGFKSDLQGETNKFSVEQDGKKASGKAVMDLKKMKIFSLVFGIFESAELKITSPKDLGLGLGEEEKDARVRVIRNLEPEIGDYLFKEITALNKEPSEELKKN